MKRVKNLILGLLLAFLFTLLTPPLRGFASSLIDIPTLFSKKELSLSYQISPDEWFLYEIAKPNFKAYFGNKLNKNSHLVKIEREDKSLIFSFSKADYVNSTASSRLKEEKSLESEIETKKESTESSKIIDLELETKVATNSIISSFTSEIATNLISDLGEIKTGVASLSGEISEIEKKFAEIKNDIKNLIPKETFLTRENNIEEVKNLEVSPEVDLAYETKDNKVKEKIILKEKSAANSFIFELNLVNLIPSFNGEVWEFKDPITETSFFFFEKPFMEDSVGNQSEDVKLEIFQEGEKNYIKITANREWLLDKNRIYPVIIDPTVATGTPANSTGAQQQRKTFYDPINNTYWVGIRASDSYIYFYYSKDGRTWTNAGTGSRAGEGLVPSPDYWSLWPAIEGNTMYVYLAISASYQLRIYKGTVSSSSISWSSTVVDCGNSHARPFISKSSGGYVWVIFNFWDGSQYYLTTVRSTSQNSISSWGSCTNLRTDFNTMHSVILPQAVSNDYMIAVYTLAQGTPSTLYYQLYTGSWGGAGTVASDLYSDANFQHFSCINDSSYNVHCVYIDQDQEVTYAKYAGGSWTTTDLTINTTSRDCTLSYNPGNGYLYAFYKQSSNYYLKIYNGSSWSNQIDTGFTEGTSPNFLTSNFSNDNHAGDNGRVFAIWSNTDSSNSVMFGRIYEVAAPIESMRHGKFFHEGAERKMTW